MFTLETVRLLVKPWTFAERPVFAALTGDVEVLRYINGGVVYGDPEIDEFFERQERQLAQIGACMGAVVEKASGNIVGLPGCVAVGETREETLSLIREAIEFHIDGLREDGDPIPQPQSTVERIAV